MPLARRALALSALGLAAPGLARGAEEPFPSRPIRVLIGYPPGGGSDLIARPILRALKERLDVPVVIENRGGANGNIAMEMAARAEPDGYTLFKGDIGNLAFNHVLHADLPFDIQRDFSGIAQLTASPSVFVVPASLPARSLGAFAALARARPGVLNFGSGGVGSSPHLFFEVWRRAAAVEVAHIPFRGAAPALQAMLAGDVQLMIGAYGIFRGAHEAGLVRVLAISSERRHARLPEVPTLREAGFDVALTGFNGLLAPVRVPAARRQLLEEAIAGVMAAPGVQRAMLDLGSAAAFTPGSALDARMREERAFWTRFAREAGIQPD
ncbi:MAG: tripartite tricarboxylate transporter substrate binding protein [Acetobacteraceae bacterium]|nr:tripartite tricarboxylate transporter substrate binding protein [Acetobacteraceae bacterium]